MDRELPEDQIERAIAQRDYVCLVGLLVDYAAQFGRVEDVRFLERLLTSRPASSLREHRILEAMRGWARSAHRRARISPEVCMRSINDARSMRVRKPR
ncbi:hypothetical protein WI61_08165 [Burkholderia cepacia]|uniref:hypothetical protein n=1 Tax=Burkholderia cepacia TaxID=292 RepID=UPI00076D47B6|nr:hypothetical protein [Burkholderia cepacia]KVB60058.1 hypothetical protein WI61_08165 [Burkholderia cepacia]KVC11723.1 hypothetical protein WI68_38800 [Burkholderia cepacia]